MNYFLGYSGDDCSDDIDECYVHDIQCGNRGVCKNIPGSFMCVCEKDYCGHSCGLSNPCLPVSSFNLSFLLKYAFIKL